MNAADALDLIDLAKLEGFTADDLVYGVASVAAHKIAMLESELRYQIKLNEILGNRGAK